MRTGIAALIALLIGAFGAHFLLADRGYVLLSFRGWTIEMSVPILLLALVLIYLGVRLLLRLWWAPRQLGEAIAGHRHRRAAARLTQGLIRMTEGDWTRGERLLTEGVAGGDTPLVNYLMAARAAHMQGSRERRNEWLRLAFDRIPEAETTVLLTQAELQYEDREYEHALATVQRVLDKAPGHAAATALLADISIAVDDHRRLVELLPRLAKLRLATPRLTEIAISALSALREDTGTTEADYRALQAVLPADVRRDPRIVRLHARLLERFGKGDEAVKAVTNALKRDWQPELVRAFGEVTASDRARQLSRVEGWLKAYPDDAVLLLTAARLSLKNELWGKARSYLESSLAIDPEPAAWSLYGQLLERLGEPDAASRAFSSGLMLSSGIDASQLALEAKPLADAD
jgi:HemY protein